MEPAYEEQFTAFVDFLGFKSVSTGSDDAIRLKILELLRGLAALRSEFTVQKQDRPDGSMQTSFSAAISTFSDHIVISYPLHAMGGEFARVSILNHFSRLAARIAAAALRIGFLIRGGVTIGKLFHAGGVVFGEALVHAFEAESKLAHYPRVVLSPQLCARPDWTQYLGVKRDHDGIFYVDYFKDIPFYAAVPGENFQEQIQSWYAEIVPIVGNNLKTLASEGRMNELAKWTWFATKLREGLESWQPLGREKVLGISLDETSSWPIP
jgi:hypothetical protein